MGHAVIKNSDNTVSPSGDIVSLNDERFYAIYHVDRMPPFFMSIISDNDHWLFVSSNGGLTAGRESPETPLFPYITVDKIHDSTSNTGCKTLVRLQLDDRLVTWEPFNQELDGYYNVSRHLYKSLLGNKLRFEEINHDLNLSFRYTWQTSAEYGFVRHCELENLSTDPVSADIIDGLQNILPAGTPAFSQLNTSYLVDAYKWTELDESNGLALYTLYSAITDRAEPAESLKANTVFARGLAEHRVLISSDQLKNFRLGTDPYQESAKRGIRGSYFVNTTMKLEPGQLQSWQLVANIEQDQAQVTRLKEKLADPASLAEALERSIANGTDKLARIMASADSFQTTAEEHVSIHHYANVLFNVLRGGIFDDQYQIPTGDLIDKLSLFNRRVAEVHVPNLEQHPDKLSISGLRSLASTTNDPQLQRLCLEYLPIAFGRRHGDPSRPWNQFSIKLNDEDGHPLLSYQGNWRDIFQNWEALVFSYPEYIESVIAKFVNASTMDGHNPYRITSEGIDWEIEDPDDPWSYIGYWGDHQIIYLLKFLELSKQFHPEALSRLLRQSMFCYANVPYRIRDFDTILADSKDTIEYDWKLAETIAERVKEIGADGKSVLDQNQEVYLVNLAEKLLVPLLAKLCNLVVEGGIWLNTQRPEWNDANNALVGQGLSMVTLYYLRRYIVFLQTALSTEEQSIQLTVEVADWVERTAEVISDIRNTIADEATDPGTRFRFLERLGRTAADYRQKVYQHSGEFKTREQSPRVVMALLDDALVVIDHSMQQNRRDSGLYHAYNLMDAGNGELHIHTLYAMLEGQVAALSSGGVPLQTAAEVIERLFKSKLYREDQHSFMLYPDRPLPEFLEKNIIPALELGAIPLLSRMIQTGDDRLVLQDPEMNYRFNAAFANAGDLDARLDLLAEEYGAELVSARQAICDLYERVFNHAAFTGRSGGMFGFEGLGSIYWHMVAKLLLAVQENFFRSLIEDCSPDITERLGTLYYRVRNGLGFNKTPAEYGAFPTDPYSHSPKHAGAQQPGMTGQVKEEILTRFGELGVRVIDGAVTFAPRLLRASEFVTSEQTFRYLDVDSAWQELTIMPGSLAFTWCQVPVIYEMTTTGNNRIEITSARGVDRSATELSLTRDESRSIFERRGLIRQIRITLTSEQLFDATHIPVN